ncbi:MAG: YicC family protein [Candidatus Aureabacteria bacterium]|nr:YicC family protein [Candidatus Auribacterota bacterium]
MALSMTGFGRASFSTKEMFLRCEIQSLNKKNFEAFFILPKFCLFAELELKKVLEKMLQRGKVTVNFDIQVSSSRNKINLNESLADSWIKAAAYFKKKYGYKNNLTVSDWLRLNEIWEIHEERVPPRELYEKIEACMIASVKKVIEMRKREGHRLQKDILKALHDAQKLLGQIAKRAPEQLKAYRQRLGEKIHAGKGFSHAEIDLFSRFIGAFSDKTDIHEEIVRLGSHFQQFKSLLIRDTPVGRTVDFLLQECNREVNTIGSKSNDLIITENVVNLKTLLEQIREQIQNIV